MAKPDIKIRYKSITILSKTLNPRPKGEFNKEVFHFDINGQNIANREKKTLVGVVNVNVREFNRENILASFSVACEFEIENFEDVIDPPKNDIHQIPPEADVLIKTMSVSTVRGIMFSELRGTYLNNAILPIIFLPTNIPANEEIISKEMD